jgi:uracil-DNA glycosylase
MVVGLNPGGDPRNARLKLRPLPKRGQHDTFDSKGCPIHPNGCPFYRKVAARLRFALPHWTEAKLRLIPQTNVNFIRSKSKVSQPAFKSNMLRCRPFFLRMVGIVQPRIIVCLGSATAKRVAQALEGAKRVQRVKVGWNTKNITVFSKWRAQLPKPWSTEVVVLGIPHPGAWLDNGCEAQVQQVLRRELALCLPPEGPARA